MSEEVPDQSAAEKLADQVGWPVAATGRQLLDMIPLEDPFLETVPPDQFFTLVAASSLEDLRRAAETMACADIHRLFRAIHETIGEMIEDHARKHREGRTS